MLKTIHVVWQTLGMYEPSYIAAAFSTPELAEAWKNLHDGGSYDDYYVGTLEVDDADDVALIGRGTRPWACSYTFEHRHEWSPETGLLVEAVGSETPEEAPRVSKYLDTKDCPVEYWELVVLAPTAADARRIAVEQIENYRLDRGMV